jgi:hypothetical protein
MENVFSFPLFHVNDYRLLQTETARNMFYWPKNNILCNSLMVSYTWKTSVIILWVFKTTEYWI